MSQFVTVRLPRPVRHEGCNATHYDVTTTYLKDGLPFDERASVVLDDDGTARVQWIPESGGGYNSQTLVDLAAAFLAVVEKQRPMEAALAAADRIVEAVAR